MSSPDWLLNGKPRPVQIEALRRSYPREGWGHFLDMRLGKSAVHLNEFMLLRRDKGYRINIVLSPNSFNQDWGEFFEYWGIDTPWHVFESSERDAFEKFVRKNGELSVVLNYEALLSKATLEVLNNICGPKTLIAADESIILKNPNSTYFKKAVELAKRCGTRRILTGKPMTQGAHDYWAQLRFIGELDGFNYYAWKNTFCVTGGFKGKQILRGEKGLKNVEELHKIFHPI